MKDNIREIFKKNIELIALIDKAIIYFREGQYNLGLDAVARTSGGINLVAEAIICNRDYFELVSTESVAEMLNNILEAKRCKDYVLLADLYEMQLCSFICSVQELIMKREDYFGFEESIYNDNICMLEEKVTESLMKVVGLKETDDEYERLRVNQNAVLREPLDAAGMLEKGYFVEFTSCGLMTVGAPGINDGRMYLHTNGRVSLEAFILAKKWLVEGVETYIVYGAGMGYHVEELAALALRANIIVFENDINILRLYCAFGKNAGMLLNDNVCIVYDPDFSFLDKRLSEFGGKEKFCVHYPSFMRVRNKDARELLSRYIPWSKEVEEC